VASLIFSASFTNHPERIITSIKIRQAKEVCEFYGLDSVQAETKAMWDTGANGCCISYELAEKLGLSKIADRPVSSFQGLSEAPVYGIDIASPDGKPLASVPATGFEKWGEFDIIIGMNVINLGNFSWEHDGNTSVFKFVIK
jgi:hypothetical protein